ncbi:hypothetical protein [Rhodoferax saidenbachensis]|uniref:hypothetical protein n=1 Tax=Rhodoferax saidenbachensis TaxID=1484693 RepID=UPI0012692F73|nr:hypothetical protein [Rhodoferax saidenbachensis]
MPQYFYIPPNATTRNYYVCLTPPKALHHIVGRNKYRESTHTSDLRKAKPIGARLIAAKLAEWEGLLATSSPAIPAAKALTSKTVDDICARRLYQWMHIDDLSRYEGQEHTDRDIQGLESLMEVSDQTMRSVIARGKASDEWEDALEVVDAWCTQIEMPVSRNDPLYPQLVRKFAEVELQATSQVRARTRGEPVTTPKQPATLGAPMSAMTNVYREHLQSSRKGKSLTTAVGLWQRFVDYLGDVPVGDIQSNDVYDFLNHGLKDPSIKWSRKYTHGKVKNTIRSVLSLAITKNLRSGPNPVGEVFELPPLSDDEEQERLNPRRPYSDIEITKVFESDWYNPRSTRWKGKMSSDLGARYWTPLICLFHGNRIREVMQLVASDFTRTNGLDCMTIQAAIAGVQPQLLAAGISRSLKNLSTKRQVPLHPQLIALGFLEFLNKRRDEDGLHALLFPSCVPTSGGKTPILGRAYEQAYLRFVNEHVGHGLGNHGYRHQLEDRIRDAQTPGNQWPAGLGQQYTGRKNTRVQDKPHVAATGSESDYGKGYKPEMILLYVKTLDFSGIKLPPSYAEWLMNAP